MKAFDYELYRVVALVKEIKGENASIEVIGYCDDLYAFYPLTESEALELFPTRGKIFAFGFARDYSHFKGCVVCLWVEPSKTVGTEHYVWNWKNGDVIEYGKTISLLKGQFSNDGQHNYEILLNNGLHEIEEDELVFSAGRVYEISADTNARIAKYWEESSLEIITHNGLKCVLGFSLSKHDGLIDISNDDQLANWYLSKVVKKNWASITQSQSFLNSESFLTELLYSLKNLDEATLQSRLSRLKTIATNLSLTFDSLNEIAETPWFSDVIAKSIARERANILKQMTEENSLELINIRKCHESELLRLEEEQKHKVDELCHKEKKMIDEFSEQKLLIEKKLQERNFDIELLDETIAEKKQIVAALEESITNLNNRKNSIIQDFSIIRDVLNMTSQPEIKKTTENNKHFSLEKISLSETPISRFKVYVKSLENVLKANDAPRCTPFEISKILAAYNVVLCPSLSIAQAFIMASHKCNYITEYVSAKWTSFDDLWKNGLEFIVTQSIESPDMMHFLLLQNINISYLPNFMQPLVDLQKGIINNFPASNMPFPNNLRLLCTVADEELIPMSKSVLQNFGCIDRAFQFNSPHKLTFADDSNLGYLTPEELIKARNEFIEVENMFEQYLDE